jgi:hypothetical protein
MTTGKDLMISNFDVLHVARGLRCYFVTHLIVPSKWLRGWIESQRDYEELFKHKLVYISITKYNISPVMVMIEMMAPGSRERGSTD